MKKSLLLSCLLLSFSSAFAGWTVGYYPYPYSKVEISSPVNYTFYGGLRVQTNSFSSNLNSDVYAAWNFKKKEQIQFYTGLGFRMNPANIGGDQDVYLGQFAVIGARVYPFEKVRPLGIVFDIAPYATAEFSSGRLESNLGLFWHFGR